MSRTLTLGTPVVRLVDGAKLGTIERLYLDPRRNRIAAFAVRSCRRLLRSLETVVDLDDVHAIGPDAVVLADADALRSRDATACWRRQLVDVATLLGRPVVTEGGTGVGRVVAVAVEPRRHRLGRLDVAAPGQAVPGLVWGDEVLHCDRVQVVVADAVLAAAPARPQQPATVRRLGHLDRRRVVRYEGRRRFLASA